MERAEEIFVQKINLNLVSDIFFDGAFFQSLLTYVQIHQS